MKDIEIKITKSTRFVDFKTEVIGNDGESLQSKLIFTFKDEFVDGQARLEYEINCEKYYAPLEKTGESYEIPIKSVMTKQGSINMQLVITQGTDENEIPIFKSNKFFLTCNESINAEIEQPEEYPDWIDVANTKLNEVDNLNIEMQDNIVTITRKDGTQYSENIKGDKGDKGDAGSIKFIIVNELPTEDIDESAMYLKKLVDEEEQNTYEEYIYVNDAWELVGTAKVEVDLTDYVKNTDYMTISKPGLAQVASGYGVWLTSTNALYVAKASLAEIDAKKHDYKPIVPANLDYAVKSVVGGHVTLTQSEYDALETIDENTYYNIVEE